MNIIRSQVISIRNDFPIITRIPVEIVAKAMKLSGESFDTGKFSRGFVESGAADRESYHLLVSRLTELIGGRKL